MKVSPNGGAAEMAGMDDMATRQVGSQEGNNEPDVLRFIVFSVLVGLPSHDDGDGEITVRLELFYR